MSRVRYFAAASLLMLGGTVLAVSVLEGLYRVAPCVWRAGRTAWSFSWRRNVHVQRDELLGWGNVPGVFIPDMYGPGVYLRTNSQGIRADRDFSRRAEPGKIRVVCTGESTTMGYGVANGKGWCEKLAALDPRLEPVNMGQIHYGLDQMYLRYLRDGVPLDADIHIVALLTVDVLRMRMAQIYGMPKPMLELRGGKPVLVAPSLPWWQKAAARLLPVTRASPRIRPWNPFGPRVVAPLSPVLNSRLRLFQGLPWPQLPREDWRGMRGLTAGILETIDRIDHERGAALVVIWLPWVSQRIPDPDLQATAELSRELGRRGIPAWGLGEEYHRWPIDRQDRLHLPNDPHYSEEGNRLVAEMVYRKLLESPRAREILAAGGRAQRRSRPSLSPSGRFLGSAGFLKKGSSDRGAGETSALSRSAK